MKNESSEERELKIHPKIIGHIGKMYRHFYGNDYRNVLLALPLKNNPEKVTLQKIETFFSSIPLGDILIVIKDLLDNDEIKRSDTDNWNYFGDYVRDWRPQLIEYLKEYGINYDEEQRQFTSSGKNIEIITSKRKLQYLIDFDFSEFFYDSLKKEINESYRLGLFNSTMQLSRKLIENLVIEILRIKFPPKVQGNLDLYYNQNGRFHDFTILLKNLEENKDKYGIDKDIISEFISLVKPFRPRANATAHSIVIVADEEEVIKYDIQKMAALLFKLWNNLKQ